jgi:ArsR family transcriptional regulator
MEDTQLNKSGIEIPEMCERWSERLSALSHPARLEILQYLAARENSCCKDVVERLSLAQSTVSQHLKVLIEAGLVDSKNEAQRSCYTLNKEALLSISEAVSDLAGSCCQSNCCSTTKN